MSGIGSGATSVGPEVPAPAQRAGLPAYAALLRLPGALRVTGPGLVGRLVVGMLNLALLLLVRHATGSYATAGAATGAFSVTAAVAGPLAGRLVDRLGPSRVLTGLGVTESACLLGLTWAATVHAPGPALIGLAAVAGGLLPPLSAFLRTLWYRLTTDAQLRHTSTAMESALLEVVFITGPVLAAVLAAGIGPAAAMVAVAAAVLVGNVGVATAPNVRAVPRGARGRTADRPGTGRLLSVGLGLLLVVLLLATVSFGVIEVAVPAAAQRGHHAAWSGALLGVWGVGSLLAGLWVGTRRAGTAQHGQLLRAVVILTLVTTPLPFASGLAVLGALLVVAGSGIAPLFVVAYQLASSLAPGDRQTEVITLVVSATLVGSAIGNTVTGVVVQHHGPTPALVMAPAVLAVAAAVTMAARRWLPSADTGTRRTPGTIERARLGPPASP